MDEIKILDTENDELTKKLIRYPGIGSEYRITGKSVINFEHQGKNYSCALSFEIEEERNVAHVIITLPDRFTLRNQEEYLCWLPEIKYQLEKHLDWKEEKQFLFFRWHGKIIFNREQTVRDVTENIIVNKFVIVTETYKERCPCAGCNHMMTYHKGEVRIPMTAKICNDCVEKGDRHAKQVSGVIENSTGG